MIEAAPSESAPGRADQDDAPPHGVTLASFAAIAAELAEGDRDPMRCLEARGLDGASWIDVSTHWNARMAAAMLADEDAPLGAAYASAFQRAQDELKPVPVMTPEAWAALVVEAARGDLAGALARRGLTRGDHLRLSRHWTRTLTRDRGEARRYEDAFYALQATPPRTGP